MVEDHVYELVNLTGHPLTMTDGWLSSRLKSEGRARVTGRVDMVERVLLCEQIGGEYAIPILENVESQVEGLLPPVKGRLYVVSGVVAARTNRRDVLTPSRIERDKNGKVVAARALMRIR